MEGAIRPREPQPRGGAGRPGKVRGGILFRGLSDLSIQVSRRRFRIVADRTLRFRGAQTHVPVSQDARGRYRSWLPHRSRAQPRQGRYRRHPAGGISEARDLAARTSYEAVLVDLDLPEEGGLELVDRAGRLLSGADGPRRGPSPPDAPGRRGHPARRRRRPGEAAVSSSPHPPPALPPAAEPGRPAGGTPRAAEPQAMVGSGPAWRSVLERASRVAATRDNAVLLQGESGTGKELIARSIHGGGPASRTVLRHPELRGLNENLLEAELFGFEKGAFTGATREGKPGVLEAADGGTVLLEEIGDLPAGLQAKLLCDLQDRRFKRVGSDPRRGGRRPDHRGHDPRSVARRGEDRFRKDLYFRISEIPSCSPRCGNIARTSSSWPATSSPLRRCDAQDAARTLTRGRRAPRRS